MELVLVLESNFVRGKIVVNFKADGTSVNSNSDTIDFPAKHNFEIGEEVFYDAKGNTPIGNLTSGATYFVRPIDDKTISLHVSFPDAVNGTNTFNIGTPSFGFHSLTSLKSKNTITNIYVKEPEVDIQIEELLFLQELLLLELDRVLILLIIISLRQNIIFPMVMLYDILLLEIFRWIKYHYRISHQNH